jgi:tetratricopeptide (TPR) repeat protein
MMIEGMNRSVFYILTGIAALVLCVTVSSAAFAPQFEQMPLSMKGSSDAKPYNDEAFMTEAEKVIGKISNSTVPTGTKLSEVTDAYYRLIMENVSPEFLETANNIVGYLYYTSKAGETYEDFHSYLNSVSKTTDGSEYYTVADQHRQVSAEFWKKIQDKFPNMTMYTLPDASAPIPEQKEEVQGDTLEGLEISIPMTQKNPDPASPDQTDKLKTTAIRWFEDYVDLANQPDDDPTNDKTEKSPGHRFLTGEGLEWVDSTYMDIIGLNVAEDFYKKANYIDAFFYLLSQARDLYEDYIDDRTYVSSVSNGQENYDKAKKYYDEANKTVGYFADIIPNGTNSTLPEFPEFGEVEKGSFGLGELGYVSSSMAEQLSGGAADTSS